MAEANFGKFVSGKSAVMMELPAERYFEEATKSVKSLLDSGFEGVYISFQRPFKNISSMFEQNGIDVNKLIVIDVAAALAEADQEKNSRCVHVSPEINIDELVKAIYTSLQKLKSERKFIFIDSLTTISLYKPLSETLRFSEFLMRTTKTEKNTILIFNVAKDLSQKRFIKDIAIQVDQVVSV